MVLEWIRRKDKKMDEYLRTYLFTDKDILDIEDQDTQAAPTAVGKAKPKAIKKPK
jgi:hypothetical protein